MITFKIDNVMGLNVVYALFMLFIPDIVYQDIKLDYVNIKNGDYL